jgi:hypothetical protein
MALALTERLAVALVALLAASGAVSAQTNADTARNWGLLGTWRLDCSKPLSTSNPDLKYVVRDGKVHHDREFGNARDSSLVASLKAKPDGTLEVIVNFTSLTQVREFTFIKGAENRIRATSNRDVNSNTYSVRNGKFTANGNDTPWQTRCR